MSQVLIIQAAMPAGVFALRQVVVRNYEDATGLRAIMCAN